MEQLTSNQDLEINNDLFTTQKLLPSNLYDIKIPIELKSEKSLNGKQYLIAIPITKFFSNLRNMYILIHILNGNSIISLRLIEYFVVNYVLDNNTYFNVKKYNKNKKFVIDNLFTKKKKSSIEDEIRKDIKLKQDNNSLNEEDLNNFDDFFMIHDNYKCQLKEYNKKNFDPFCRWTRIRFYYSKQNYFFTTIAQLNFFKWMIENYIVDYILDNLSTIEKSMIEYEKRVKEDKLKRNNSDILQSSQYFDVPVENIVDKNSLNDNININNNNNQLNDMNVLNKDMNILNNDVEYQLNIDPSIKNSNSINDDKIFNNSNLTNNKLKNCKTKKKDLHTSNSEKKTKLKGRVKKEFTKTNRSILKYNCSKIVSFD